MHNSALLVDAEEFRASIETAVRQARRRVLIQVMTFEMDSVGHRFWDALTRSPAREKILCVDAFSRAKISDDLVFGSRFLTDSGFRQEVRDTRKLLCNQERDGVRIVVTNPVGVLGQKYALRNHKKIMVVDDTAFLGGINFSEHNFSWHDLMLQTNCPPLVESLAADFHQTIAGVNQSATQEMPFGRLYYLDGRRTQSGFEQLFDEITAARQSIDVISPYVSSPLLERLAGMDESVRVRIINPAVNNKPILQQALFKTAAGSPLEIRLYEPKMSHLKAILVDDNRLILGSYNFDFVGYAVQQEVVLSTAEPGLVSEFRERVLAPDLNASTPAFAKPARFHHRGGFALGLAKISVRLAGWLRQYRRQQTGTKSPLEGEMEGEIY